MGGVDGRPPMTFRELWNRLDRAGRMRLLTLAGFALLGVVIGAVTVTLILRTFITS